MTTIHHTPKHPVRLIRRKPDPDREVNERIRRLRKADPWWNPESRSTLTDDYGRNDEWIDAQIHRVVDPLIRDVAVQGGHRDWPKRLVQKILCAMDCDGEAGAAPRAAVDEMIHVMSDLLAPTGHSGRDDVLRLGLSALLIAFDPANLGHDSVKRFQRAAQVYRVESVRHVLNRVRYRWTSDGGIEWEVTHDPL